MKENNIALDCLRNILRQQGETKKGTYNRADPTAFEKRHIYIHIYADVWHEAEEGSQDPENPYPPTPEGFYPEAQIWLVELNDNTWGETFEVSQMTDKYHSKTICENYWSEGKWHWDHIDKENKAQNLLEKIVTQATFLEDEKAMKTAFDYMDKDVDDAEYYNSLMGDATP